MYIPSITTTHDFLSNYHITFVSWYINKQPKTASYHWWPCNTGGCRVVASTWNLGTCMHLYKKGRHTFHVEEDNWKSKWRQRCTRGNKCLIRWKQEYIQTLKKNQEEEFVFSIKFVVQMNLQFDCNGKNSLTLGWDNILSCVHATHFDITFSAMSLILETSKYA